jgi:hypothetical protein
VTTTTSATRPVRVRLRTVGVAAAVAAALLAAAPVGAAAAGGAAAGNAAAKATIPGAAFLQPADTHDAWPIIDHKGVVLPRLCGKKFASDAAIKVRKAKHVPYWTKPKPGFVPDGAFLQTITRYRAKPGDKAAKKFMRELRAAVKKCPKQRIGGLVHRNRLLDAPAYGHDSILLRHRYPERDYATGELTGRTETRLVSVVRVRSVVMVLFEVGWEGGSSRRKVVNAFTGKALNRLEAWLC